MTASLLDRLLIPGALRLVVQPIVKVSNGRVDLQGVECLTRGPRGSLFERPDVLFDYVRRKKAEVTVDRTVITSVLRDPSVSKLKTDISLNVHASTLGRDRGFATFLADLANEAAYDLAHVTVEIVEHSPMWHQSQFLQSILDLKALGVRIALDDFGLGQSNYRMVMEADPDRFKLDAFFVRGLKNDSRRRATVRSIVQLAKDLGADCVAEGVETTDQVEALQDLQVRFMQGFLFARPVAPELLLNHGSWVHNVTQYQNFEPLTERLERCTAVQ